MRAGRLRIGSQHGAGRAGRAWTLGHPYEVQTGLALSSLASGLLSAYGAQVGTSGAADCTARLAGAEITELCQRGSAGHAPTRNHSRVRRHLSSLTVGVPKPYRGDNRHLRKWKVPQRCLLSSN